MRSFPKTADEFKALFPDEAASLRYLFNMRWPQGFECSYCNWLDSEQLPARTMTCGHCGHPGSITTNTIMHGTKKPLSEWLFCIWWFAGTTGGHSAKDLQRLLKLSSYQTAWTWLQKLRMAMAVTDSKMLQGTIEVSGETEGNVSLIAGAELILPAGITGRIKMKKLSEITPQTVNNFTTENIKSGSSLIIPELEHYRSIAKNNFTTINSAVVERSHEIIKTFGLWLNKIHRGGVASKHLQLYLDEFCFRSNTAMLPNEEAIFKLLLQGVLSSKSMSYKSMIAKTGKE